MRLRLFSSILPVVLLFSTGNIIAQTSIEEIIGDMTLLHEGRPHGVPDSYNWAIKPRPGAVTPPDGWNAAIAWGQVYEWIGINPAVNTRVQIKDLELYYLSKTDNKWHLLQKSIRVDGNAYVEDFKDDVNKPADKRLESDGSISVTCGNGYNFHFWPLAGRVKYPVNEVAGCFVTVKARLIMDDPLGVDDRTAAKYVMSVGGDWWLSLTAPWDQFKTNSDMGIGRFRFVTPEWKSYNMFSVPVDTIKNNPPPFMSITTSVRFPSEKISEMLVLEQNFPNPFCNSTQINFFLPQPGFTRLSVLDIEGKLVSELVESHINQGSHSILWDASNLQPGNYLISLVSSGINLTVKSQLIR